ncbi:hypothetical protein [Pararhizobium sp.]|uniref:hypothetical protein n=1 Tax=Pararhizobium sp. TaxID=1977563 RepID=UPI002726BF19|nr:hypothetical protein [Pararhizobium sp.]MDO9417169.1 hypothetical protein [Pararhizobium sp.]
MRLGLLALTGTAFALPAYLSIAAPARDARQNAMEKIADVVALARICPALEMNSAFVTSIAIGTNIGQKDDYQAIEAMANAREGEIRRKGEEVAACADGASLYGTGGTALPGMMRKRPAEAL